MSEWNKFNASDYEESFQKFCDQGQFELAQKALTKAQALRDEGDDSTCPTKPTFSDWLSVAQEFQALANHFQQTADLALRRANQTNSRIE